jgi:hypothetical protein
MRVAINGMGIAARRSSIGFAADAYGHRFSTCLAASEKNHGTRSHRSTARPRKSCVRAGCRYLPEERFSHWVTHADWGCRDGHHQAWLVVDVDGEDEARQIAPPAFRDEATVTRLNKFYRRRD